MVPLKIVYVTIFALFGAEVYAKGKGGLNLMTTQLLQDEYKVELNELSDYIDMDVELINPGTPDSILNVNAKVHKELPPTVEIVVKGEKLNRKGQYEDTPLFIKKNYCNYIRMDKIIYPIIAASGNFPKECPVKPGEYQIKNFKLNGDALPFGVPAGTYKLSFSYKLDNKMLISTWYGRSINV